MVNTKVLAGYYTIYTPGRLRTQHTLVFTTKCPCDNCLPLPRYSYIQKDNKTSTQFLKTKYSLNITIFNHFLSKWYFIKMSSHNSTAGEDTIEHSKHEGKVTNHALKHINTKLKENSHGSLYKQSSLTTLILPTCFSLCASHSHLLKTHAWQ